MLSEVDKWSQKYTRFRKMTVYCLVILIMSVIGFFLTLSSALISTTCLITSFLAVLGIRIGLSKMDEFKSLYVNTVPMISPEKDFKEAKLLEESDQVMETSGTTMAEVEFAMEVLETEGQLLVELEEVEKVVETNELGEVSDAIELIELGEVEEVTELIESEEVEKVTELIESGEVSDAIELIESGEVEEVTALIESEEVEEVTELLEVEEVEEEVTLSLEEQVFETVKMILRMNHCEIENLSFKIVGNYLTIYLKNRVMMRLKLTGRKQYVLTFLSQAEVEALGLIFEAPSKSEAYNSRVQFTSIAVLAQLEAQIVKLYERIVK